MNKSTEIAEAKDVPAQPVGSVGKLSISDVYYH